MTDVMPDRCCAILGIGALNGFYGAWLHLASLDIHLLLHGDYEHVSKHGTIAELPDGDLTLPQVHVKK